MSYGEIEKTGHFIAFFKERSKYLDGTGTMVVLFYPDISKCKILHFEL